MNLQIYHDNEAVYTGAHPPALQQGGKHGMPPETIIRRHFTDCTM